MKKLIILCFFVSVTAMLNAQGFHLGPQVGFSMTSFIEKDDFSTPDYSLKMGYQLGLAAEFEIMSFVYVGASVSFFEKGTKIVNSFSKSKLKLGYMDIPIYIGYKIPLANISVFGNVGPYSSVAVVGKSQFHSEVDEYEFEENHPVEFGSELGTIKRFDTGLVFGGGVEFMQWQLKVNYALGFVDINNSEYTSSKNSVLNLTCTYFIGRNF
ncbi:MAG: porin family protein [Bacteroidales bacterium]|nr:porin family protein [Bacteroidales bacterium]